MLAILDVTVVIRINKRVGNHRKHMKFQPSTSAVLVLVTAFYNLGLLVSHMVAVFDVTVVIKSWKAHKSSVHCPVLVQSLL